MKRSSDMFNELNWLISTDRCKYFTGLMVYKCLHDSTPSYINNLINFAANIHYELRSICRNDITQNRKPTTNYLKRTFNYASKTIWNQIPTDIRCLSNINTFKTRFKSFLMSSTFQIINHNA